MFSDHGSPRTHYLGHYLRFKADGGAKQNPFIHSQVLIFKLSELRFPSMEKVSKKSRNDLFNTSSRARRCP